MIEPYYADDTTTLYLGDFRDVLPDLYVEVDLIVADPPYGETSLEWDTWPTGWPTLLLQGYGQAMWCFGSMRMFLDHGPEFGGWKLSQDVIWQKHRPSTVATDRFARTHEHALHWYRGQWSDVHHDTPKIPHTGPRRTHRGRPNTTVNSHVRGSIGAAAWEDDGTRWQPTIIPAETVHRSRSVNETEKPVGLLEPLISYGCPPGGTVLDPFAGSCSTAVAARAIGRRSVCIEKRESQCEAAAKRLSQGVLDFGGVA